ncbi:uncharacterized protein [Acropora muricata]|uniref:uncharacterized protein n=1 Tax=Acropora muricata TaxID=159855 RepID=UPI0034E46F08
MREQFRLRPRLSESLNVGIRLGDMQYTMETEVFEELQDRRPIAIDPTLVRAAQLADIHLLNEAKERGNDLKFLVQMCFGLEEGFNGNRSFRLQDVSPTGRFAYTVVDSPTQVKSIPLHKTLFQDFMVLKQCPSMSRWKNQFHNPAFTTTLRKTPPHKVTYQLVEGGTKRAKTKLADSDGYTYNVQLRRANVTYWQCTVRPKGNHCRAIVIQRGNEFQQGKQNHNHPPAAGAATAATVMASVKGRAVEDQFKPASAIVNEVLLNELGDEPCPALPKPHHLARAANRIRQSTRPKDPIDLDFDLQQDQIPNGFLKADIKKHGNRHIILGTDQQLEHLSKAKSWYIDGTFKLVKRPFQQLFTINAFVRTDDHAKQVPLVFVLMSGRKKKDYRKVLKSILELLPVAHEVRQITIDFERAMWSVLRQLFPDVRIKGCVFHWTQALWRKIQELGLQYQYNHDRGTYLYLRKFMALPFLPEDNIQPMFEQLRPEATTDPLKQFVNYVSETWISSNTWPPSSWSVYMMAIRSNNDVEGWHNGLHRRASGRWHMPFYLLIGLLHEEARLTALRIRLVSEKKLKRIQRAKFRSLQAKIFDLWDDFVNQGKNAEQLLRQCAHLHGPSKAFTQRSS